MKLRELFEAPELRNRTIDAVEEKWINREDTFISFNAADRSYYALKENSKFKTENEQPVKILMTKKHYMSIAAIPKFNKATQEDALLLLSKIMFKDHISINLPKELKNVLQVDKVVTVKRYQDTGLASYMYALIAKNGFTIVSDTVQYLGGKQLWKRMARLAHLNDYKINIWDQRTGYVKDENGNILEHNISNIDDAIIWKENSIGQQTVLILSNK